MKLEQRRGSLRMTSALLCVADRFVALSDAALLSARWLTAWSDLIHGGLRHVRLFLSPPNSGFFFVLSCFRILRS